MKKNEKFSLHSLTRRSCCPNEKQYVPPSMYVSLRRQYAPAGADKNQLMMAQRICKTDTA
jgi:hypothetical protein